MSIVSPTKFAEVDLAPLELWGRSATRVCLGESLARVQLDAIFGESPARGRSGMRISRASSSRARFTVASVWANTEPALGGKSGWRPQVWRVVQVGDAQRGKAERPARVSHVLQVEATGERGLSSAMSTLRPYGSWPRSTITITPHHHGPVRQRLAEVADGEMFVDEVDVDGTVVRTTHRIEALGDGGVRVVYRLEASGPGAEVIGEAVSSDFGDTLTALVGHVGG